MIYDLCCRWLLLWCCGRGGFCKYSAFLPCPHAMQFPFHPMTQQVHFTASEHIELSIYDISHAFTDRQVLSCSWASYSSKSASFKQVGVESPTQIFASVITIVYMVQDKVVQNFLFVVVSEKVAQCDDMRVTNTNTYVVVRSLTVLSQQARAQMGHSVVRLARQRPTTHAVFRSLRCIQIYWLPQIQAAIILRLQFVHFANSQMSALPDLVRQLILCENIDSKIMISNYL